MMGGLGVSARHALPTLQNKTARKCPWILGFDAIVLQHPAHRKHIPAAAHNARHTVFALIGPEEFDTRGGEDRLCAGEFTAGGGRLQNHVQSKMTA